MRRLFVIGLGIYFALFIFNSLTRTRQFSPDSMNYVDVARNFASGRGLAQSTMGFNQPVLNLDKGYPVPFTAQAPVYPIMIGFLSKLSISCEDAALLISGLGYAAALGLVVIVARRIVPGEGWYFAAGLMLLAAPMRMIGRCAWSESISLAVMTLSILCILKLRDEPEKRNLRISFLAGLFSGGAFAVRYAFGVFPLLGLIFLFFEYRRQRACLFKIAVYLLGCLLPFGGVLFHNHATSGFWMPKALNSDQPFSINLQDGMLSIFGSWMGEGRFQAEQVAVLCLGLGLSSMYIFLRRKSLESIKEVFIGQGRYLLSFWALIYFSFIVLQRSTQHFDPIGTRLMMPVIVMGIILLACLIAEMTRMMGGKSYGRPFLWITILIACGLEIFIFVSRQPYDRSVPGFSSERLNWIAGQTTAKDLIIGDNAVDIPFYLKRPEVISFSPFPYSAHFSPETLQEIVRRYRNSYSRIMIVLRKNNLSDDRERYFYGDFVSSLRSGKTAAYREVILIQELRDCLVYQVRSL
jgi:4-amino-4-deoxy-L-arabinose transferase-like glycosyltransferase